jgi:hypothetical protein
MNRIKIAIILSLAVPLILASMRCGGNVPQKPTMSKEQQQRIDAELARMQANQAKALEASRKEQECASNSLGYLYSLRTGDSVVAAAFWKPGISPKTLFAVESYREIRYGTYLMRGGKEYNPSRLFHEFEVESSTKGGFPIRKRWNIVMEPGSKNFADRDCAIVDLVEAE